MNSEVYRYTFPTGVLLEEVEASLLLAVFAAESLHGETEVRMAAAHAFDLDARACVIDAGTSVGRNICRLFIGFLSREFGADAFRVERVDAPPQARTEQRPVAV
jgi:hypothetical protein